MKIAFLLTQGLKDPSGLGRYWPLAKELTKLGHKVAIIALHPNFKSLERRCFNEQGVTVYYVSQMHIHKAGSYKRYFNPFQLIGISILAALRLAVAALRVRADVYHICKPHPMNGIAAWLTGFIKGKPLYLDCDDFETASNRFSGRWQKTIVAFFEQNLPGIVKGVTTNTRFMERLLQRWGVPRNRIIYVPNGVDRERFQPLNGERIKEIRRQLKLEGRPVVLYIGSLSLVNHAVD
ncbi:glycosyltransferase WbuB, partial [Candidatus Woesearchaeota archaeon]